LLEKPGQVSGDNLNNVRHETGRTFGTNGGNILNKEKNLMRLKQTLGTKI
jgi:hypothetical protein